MADKDLAGLLDDSLSPLTAAGIDPDEARANPKAALDRLRGTNPNVAEPETWLDQIKRESAAPGQSVQQVASTPAAPASTAPAAPSGGSAVPAAVTKGGSPQSWADIQRSIVSQGQSSMRQANDALSTVANQPSEDEVVSPLEAQRAKAAAPINPSDYKPSFGQRFVRGLQGFGRGGILGAVDPTIGGAQSYGAPTKQFSIDKDQQTQNLASIDQQITQKKDAFKAASDRAKALGTEARANAGMQKDLSAAVTGQEGAETAQAKLPIEQQQADAQTAEAYNRSPEAKAATTEKEFAAAQQKADQLGLKGQNRILFLANGKIPDPRQATEGEIAMSQATRAFTQEHGRPPQTLAEYAQVRNAVTGAGDRADTKTKGEVLKAYQPTLDSAERFNIMSENYEKAVKDHDQQAMLSLLANHLGMTMGLQKGARLTKDIIREAQQSTPWLQGMAAKFDKDGVLSGVTLTPNQMRQMVGLGQSRFGEDAKKSSNVARYLGSSDSGPERTPNASTIRYYTALANGDANKAKDLAAQDGWTIGTEQ